MIESYKEHNDYVNMGFIQAQKKIKDMNESCKEHHDYVNMGFIKAYILNYRD